MSLSSASAAAAAAAAATTTGDGNDDDVPSLKAALGQTRGENAQLIGKMKELLGRHKALQKSAGEWKAQGEEARGYVGICWVDAMVYGLGPFRWI